MPVIYFRRSMNSQTTMTMWIIFIAVTVLTKQCQGVSPYCNITSVEEGQDATLVIHFSENVGILQTNFSILHRAINSSKDIEILKCHFPNGNLECEHHQPCCSHDATVNETFRVFIHKVTHDKEGLYAGVVMPIINGDPDYCKLSIKGVEETVDVLLIVAVTVSAVVLLAVIIVTIVIFKHCKSKQKDKRSKDRLEGDSNEENKPLTTKPESTSGHEDEGPKAQSEGECDEEKALLTKFKEPIKNADTKDTDENLLPNDSERSENEKSTDVEEPGRSDSPPTRRKPYKDTLHRNFDNTLIELVYKVQERYIMTYAALKLDRHATNTTVHDTINSKNALSMGRVILQGVLIHTAPGWDLVIYFPEKRRTREMYLGSHYGVGYVYVFTTLLAVMPYVRRND